MDWNAILLFIICLGGLLAVVVFLLRPIKFALNFLFCVVVGFVLLSLTNLALGFAGLHVGVNPVTVLTAGILQVPGAIMLALLTVILPH